MPRRATENNRISIAVDNRKYCHTYYIACFHVTPNRLLTAAPILKTSDVNQNVFTAFAMGVLVASNENCMVVAVTAEKKVATVDKFSKF